MIARAWVSQTVLDQFGAIVTDIEALHNILGGRTNKYQKFFDNIYESLQEGLNFLDKPEMPRHSVANAAVALDPAVTLSTISVSIKTQLRLMIDEKSGLQDNNIFHTQILDIVEKLGKFRNACEREIEAKQPQKEVKEAARSVKLDVLQSALEERKVPTSVIQNQIDLISELPAQQVSCFSIFSHAARFHPKKMIGSGAAFLTATSPVGINVLSHYLGEALDLLQPNLTGLNNETLAMGALVASFVVIGSGLGARALYSSWPKASPHPRDLEEGNNKEQPTEGTRLLRPWY